jgi:hypothetical protein
MVERTGGQKPAKLLERSFVPEAVHVMMHTTSQEGGFL